METFRTIFLTTHIATGALILLIFWVAILAKKGPGLHKLAGKLYAYTMAIALLAAAVLCVTQLFKGNYFMPLILGFLTLISGNALWQGYSFARDKGLTPLNHKLLIGLSATITLYAIPLLIVGIMYQQVLFIIFGALGALTGPLDLKRFIKEADTIHKNWLRQHYASMIISGGAAYTAFLAFGARSFINIDNTALAAVPWVLPTIIAMILIQWYNRRYKPVKRTA